MKELNQKRMPLIVRRYLPDGWYVFLRVDRRTLCPVLCCSTCEDADCQLCDYLGMKIGLAKSCCNPYSCSGMNRGHLGTSPRTTPWKERPCLRIIGTGCILVHSGFLNKRQGEGILGTIQRLWLIEINIVVIMSLYTKVSTASKRFYRASSWHFCPFSRLLGSILKPTSIKIPQLPCPTRCPPPQHTHNSLSLSLCLCVCVLTGQSHFLHHKTKQRIA